MEGGTVDIGSGPQSASASEPGLSLKRMNAFFISSIPSPPPDSIT